MRAERPLVEAAKLRKTYPIVSGGIFKRQVGVSAAVDDVSFEIRRGETFGLVGESGCGKSTTGRLLMRLIEPDSGSVRFDGIDLGALDRCRLNEQRRRMQLIPQEGRRDRLGADAARGRLARTAADPRRRAAAASRARG